MDSEKVIQDLNQRFAQPLPEFYKRRIIFWCDEEREFEDKLDEIVLHDAKLIALTGKNYFAVKKLLGVEDTTGNYVVYCPLSYEKPEDDWLLDIRLYSEEYRADLISNWMDEMGLPQTAALRTVSFLRRLPAGKRLQSRRIFHLCQDSLIWLLWEHWLAL